MQPRFRCEYVCAVLISSLLGCNVIGADEESASEFYGIIESTPVVQITGPSDGTAAQGTFRLTATVTDEYENPLHVRWVDLFVNDTLVRKRRSSRTGNYAWRLNPADYAERLLTLSVRSPDFTGSIGEAAIVVTNLTVPAPPQEPAVQTITPLDSSEVDGPFVWNVHASDAAGNPDGIAKIDFFVGSVLVKTRLTDLDGSYAVLVDPAVHLGEQLQLTAIATDLAGNASSSATVIVTKTQPPVEPPPPEEDPIDEAKISSFKAYFDQQFALRAAEWEAQSLAGGYDSKTYYRLQLQLDGVISMFEATDDSTYLEVALRWIENMISTAHLTTGNRKYPAAIGWERTDGRNDLLDEGQAIQPMARLARLILTRPALATTYGGRATAIRDFVDQNILKKWMVDRHFGNFSQGWNWMLGIHNEPNGTLTGYFQDHQAHCMRAAQDIYDAGAVSPRRGDETWGDLARQIAEAWKMRLVVQPNGAYLWDVGRFMWTASKTGIYDTYHANRYAYAMVTMQEAGTVFDYTDATRLARTLTQNIWNGRYAWGDTQAAPGQGTIWFSNYIDGQDIQYDSQLYTVGGPSHPHYGTPNGMAGMVYDGWCRLGAVDQQAQSVCEALLDFMKSTSSSVNAIHNRNRAGEVGTVALAGHLARNLRLRQWSRDTPPLAP
jgi:hypothetical protein